MKTKLLAVLVMLFSFSCLAYEPGTLISRTEIIDGVYHRNTYQVQSDGTEKLVECENKPGLGLYLEREQEAKEVVSISKGNFNNFNVKYKDGHEEQYHLNKDGKLCKGILPCR